MLRRTSLPAVLALCLALLVPAGAQAIDQPGCHGTYRGAANCQFLIEGFPITILGQADTSNAPVRVWITIDGYPQAALLECSGAGKCEDDRHLEGLVENFPNLVPRLRARCFVEGQGTGFYSCGSGKYVPPSA